MKTKFIILAVILMVLLLPANVLAAEGVIKNIIWEKDYSIKFDEVSNAASYKYSFSVNSTKTPSTLFPITNFELNGKTVSFFPAEGLKHFNSDTPAIYTVWIVALDENNNKLTELTQGTGGKILISSRITIPELKTENEILELEKPEESQPEKKEELKNVEDNKKVEIINKNDNWENPFEDISENAWYYNSVKFSNQNNLLNGITDTQFGPKTHMTRGMLAQVLYKHSKDDTNVNYSLLFSDVKESAYYYNAISWMCENNISSGMGKNMFKPNDPVTREQLITILYNYSIYLGKDVKSITMDFSSFEDSDSIHAWAKVPLCWALKNNLIGGRTEKTLAPREATTRAEFATILMRFLNL